MVEGQWMSVRSRRQNVPAHEPFCSPFCSPMNFFAVAALRDPGRKGPAACVMHFRIGHFSRHSASSSGILIFPFLDQRWYLTATSHEDLNPLIVAPSQNFVSGSSTWMFSLTLKKLDSMVRFSNWLEIMKTRGLINNEIFFKMINVEHTFAGNKIYFDCQSLYWIIIYLLSAGATWFWVYRFHNR